MFGLMRPKNSCSNSLDQQYLFHRTHYCGTCKAIGKEFNHKSRMLLNFDTVFLSELLSLFDEEQIGHWESNLQKVNTCWSMPTDDLPFSLRYSAAVSVLLGELKVDDHIKDNKLLRWKLAQRLYSKSFQIAAQKFETWEIDTSPIYNWVEEQVIREKNSTSFKSLESCLDYYAEATAQITGQLFEEGGQKTSSKISLKHLGYQFGKLMYILDAFEDYERDVFQGQFNPLALFWGSNKTLNSSQLEIARTTILNLQEELCQAIQALPLEQEKLTLYQDRLTSNLSLRLYKERIVPTTQKERIQLRWKEAKISAAQLQCATPSWIHQLNYYVLVWAVFLNPQTVADLPQDGKFAVFKWMLVITATLASLGLVGVIIKKSKEEKRAEKQKEKRLKTFLKKLKRLFSKKKNCGDCCSSMCTSGCCDNCCSNIDCSDCFDDCDLPWWGWVLLILLFLICVGIGVVIAMFI